MPQPSPLLNLPETRPERWSLLSDLVAEWYGALKPGDGYGDDELRRAAERLKISIPVSMREWYGLAGRRDDVWSQQDTLLSPEKLCCEDGVLQFCIENQGVTCWGMPVADLSRDDPSVVVRDEDQNWVVQSRCLSEFVLHMFACVVQFAACPAHIYGYAEPSCLERIVSSFPALGFPEFIWGRTRLFGFRDLIISADYTHHVSASGQSKEALTPFRRLIESGDFDVIQETA